MEGKSEIVVISNRHKDIFNSFINSSDPKSLDWARPIYEKLCNTSRSVNNLTKLSKRSCLDKNILAWSIRKALKIEELQVHQYYNIAAYGPKSGKKQYKKGKRVQKGRKRQRSKENRKRDKINLVLAMNAGSHVSIYHYIIYRYQQRLIILGWDMGLSTKP